MNTVKFSDLFADQLLELGYTHCYFVAGGNIMHLLNSVRTRFKCIPFAHEVGAAIATEYHNASITGLKGRAFCLVTAGPGLTNAVTGVAGAWQESRELLIVGGQVKTSDLASDGMRQRGIQEVNGVELLRSITKAAFVSIHLISFPRLLRWWCQVLHTQGARFPRVTSRHSSFDGGSTRGNVLGYFIFQSPLPSLDSQLISQISSRVAQSSRPIFLIGGGVDHCTGQELAEALSSSRLPLMTTYNGADRVDNHLASYFGRPNTWGMRYSNILLQQADLIVALGTRLGLQQTGFNWQEFGNSAHLIQVDIDPIELNKGHPYVDEALCGDANHVLRTLFIDNGISLQSHQQEWLDYCQFVKLSLPLSEDCNSRNPNYISHTISGFSSLIS